MQKYFLKKICFKFEENYLFSSFFLHKKLHWDLINFGHDSQRSLPIIKTYANKFNEE